MDFCLISLSDMNKGEIRGHLKIVVGQLKIDTLLSILLVVDPELMFS